MAAVVATNCETYLHIPHPNGHRQRAKSVTTSIIYATVGDQKEADLIASKIVEERLASSVNIVDSVRSYYWWSSAVQQQEEFLLIAKTRTAVVMPQLKESVLSTATNALASYLGELRKEIRTTLSGSGEKQKKQE